jgi:hypothetical protein
MGDYKVVNELIKSMRMNLVNFLTYMLKEKTY